MLSRSGLACGGSCAHQAPRHRPRWRRTTPALRPAIPLGLREVLDALGLDATALPGWWQGWPPRLHVKRWRDELGLTEAEIVAVAEASRQGHPEPPDGPKALDRAMQRAAQRKVADAGWKRRKPRAEAAPTTKPITDLPAFYADLVNSDRYLPVSAFSNTMRDAMLARGLVTPERLRMRGVR